MWPFATRGSRASAGTSPATDTATIDPAAYAVNDVAIKVWLPQKVVDALQAVSAATDTSRPDVVRALLFAHVHGRVELERLHAWSRTRRSAADADQELKAAAKRRQEDVVAGIRVIGKSVEDFKLWLPSPLRASLAELASAEDLGLSDYVRKVLVYSLLGETFHRRWQQAIGRVPIEYREMERD